MTDHMDIQLDKSLSIQEAAAYYSVSEKTIRRRIKNGTLPAFQYPTPQGFEWRVQLPTQSVHVDIMATQETSTPHNQIDNAPRQDQNTSALVKALDLVERLQQENIQLAGQLGFYQAKLQEAEQQIRLLTTTNDQEIPTDDKSSSKPWWKKLLRKKPTIDK